MLPDPQLAEYASKVIYWANNERLVQRIFIFGSRVRGDHTASSDIDIAIELPYADRDENLAHFLFEHDRWAHELSRLLGREVDVQMFEKDSNSIVYKGVSERSILAFSKFS